MSYVKKGAQTEVGRKIEELAERAPEPVKWMMPDPYSPASYIFPMSVGGKALKSAWPKTKTFEEALEKITNRIYDRLSYGLREELITEPSRKVLWSNNSGRWFVYPGKHYKPGEMVKLDANEIVAPQKFIRRLKMWFESGDAPALPLFEGSFEATKMGKSVRGEQFIPSSVREKMNKITPEIDLFKKIGELAGIKKEPIQ
jgi:hypothetical protein